MELWNLYKSRKIPTLAESLAKRTQRAIAERQEKQRNFFQSKREGLECVTPPEPVPLKQKKNARAEMLKKWKEEKMKKVEEAKKTQKPIFKVGIVQRKVTGSPLLAKSNLFIKKNSRSDKENVNQKISMKSVTDRQGIMTRSRTKILAERENQPKQNIVAEKKVKCEGKMKNTFCKIENGEKKQLRSTVFKVPEPVSNLPFSNKLVFPYSPEMCKRTRKIKSETKEKCEDKKNTPNMIAQKQINLEKEVVNKTPSPKTTSSDVDDFRPIHYSPFVTVRSNGRSGKKCKKPKTLYEEIKKEDDEFHCRIFSFRKYIECESRRLLEKCEKWKHIYEEFEEVPPSVEGDIDSVVGKTNLLTSDKFKQFKDLVDKCEGGDPLIKVDDLQGFQDWVSIEVEKIDGDFYKLEQLKCNNWMREDAVVEKKAEKEKNVISKKRPVGKSNIRAHIMAARKQLKEGNVNDGVTWKLPVLATEDIQKMTPRRSESLLKQVLSSEKKRERELVKDAPSPLRERRNSGLEIMVATQKHKILTPAKNSPLKNVEIFVSENQTSVRSILRKTPHIKETKCRVTFENLSENKVIARRGLDEKYFKPCEDEEGSPLRMILGDVGNVTPRRSTRSRPA